MSFSSQVDNAVMKINNRADKTVRTTLLGVFSNTIRATPVNTGRLRNNWFTSTNAPVDKERGQALTKKGKKSKASSDATANAKDVTKKFRMGDDVYFTNNLPYAYIIEFGGIVSGSRRQGNFMLTQAVANATRGS
mgnify:CR=1 FL=1